MVRIKSMAGSFSSNPPPSDPKQGAVPQRTRISGSDAWENAALGVKGRIVIGLVVGVKLVDETRKQRGAIQGTVQHFVIVLHGTCRVITRIHDAHMVQLVVPLGKCREGT